MTQKQPKPQIRSFVDTWRKRGAAANEGDLYDIFATYIVRGILGYTSEEYNITPRSKRGGGAPDLRLKTKDGMPWVVVEAKVDDRLIRRVDERARLWRDKKKYVDDQTAYFLWVTPGTFLLCDAAGEPLSGLRIPDGQPELDMEVPDPLWRVATSDQDVLEALSLISAEAGRERKYLERFRLGEMPYGYIPVTRDTVDHLTGSLQCCVSILLDYLVRSQATLKAEYEEYSRKRPGYAQEARESLWQYKRDELEARHAYWMRRFDRSYEPALRFHEAFHDFCFEQSYTRFEKERNETEDAALERIFRANAAYVAIGRLLFVRLAEDQELIRPKISNGGIKFWKQVLDNGGMVARWVGLAFADAERVCKQLFAQTPFDSLMRVDDPAFDDALLRVLFRLNAFDLSGLSNDVDVLGAIYQGILDRKLRKDVGEFYTDQEVVEYILARVGLKEAARAGSQVRLLDPACGSGAFLVRAAGILREEDAKRGLPKQDVQERIGAAIHGLDINHFAVYIADMNLLFATFDLTASTRRPARFSVHCVNSLLKDMLPLPDASGPTYSKVTAADEADACTASKYDFVVGNPPYVRAERLPDEDRVQLKSTYSEVHGEGNVDLAVYFISRALEWLEPGGMMGMILPRAIADAAFAAPLRRLLESDECTLEELVPLDWACHELFDSDVVPFLLFVRKAPRPRGHKVSLVQGLRSKDDLLARAEGRAPAGTRTSKIPWAAFKRLSVAGWPMEVTADDLPILQKMRTFPTMGSVAKPRFGIKAGSTGAAMDIRPGQSLPEDTQGMLTGAEIHAFSCEAPRRAVNLSQASDPSIWAPLVTLRGSLPEAAVAVPEIHLTLNAAIVRPPDVCCQNNIVLLTPLTPADTTAYALCALVNSSAARYWTHLTLRAGVAGGGRRDFTIYPRTLSALPVPRLAPVQWSRLDRLSRVAHESGALRAQSPVTTWRKCVGKSAKTLVRDWPLDFGGWPEDRILTDDTFAPELDEDNGVLQLDPNISIGGALPLLRYMALHLSAYIEEAVELSKKSFVRQHVVAPDSVEQVLLRYENGLAEQVKAEARYRKAVRMIDEIVERGFGLSRELRERLARRMNEFPLNENANRPRLPWEQSKKPKGRSFAPGERYHTR